MTIYEEIGAKHVINAAGSHTSLGGAIMPPEVVEAMDRASEYYVDMRYLQDRAGEIIAEITGAENAWVTSGAAAAIVLATAACITGNDIAKTRRLPNTDGMKNEVIVQRGQILDYIQEVQMAGAKIIEIGKTVQTHTWELDTAINDKTAAVFFFLSGSVVQRRNLTLEQVVDIAHKKGVPVIVDAALMVPPISNLKKYISMGADLVCYSGGKGIMGPNDTGFVCGRKDLIDAVKLQGGLCYFGIGRPMKVSKEQIVGLIFALRRILKVDIDELTQKEDARVNRLVKAFSGIPYVCVEPVRSEITQLTSGTQPGLNLHLEEDKLGVTAQEVESRLRLGTPSIQVNPAFDMVFQKDELGRGIFNITVRCYADNEEQIIIDRIKEILVKK